MRFRVPRLLRRNKRILKVIFATILVCLLLSGGGIKPTEAAKPTQSNNHGTVIGIDLGTTMSCVAVMRDGKVEIIPNDLGNRITPSVVSFTDTQRLIGDAAKYQSSSNPANTIHSIKRIIGQPFSDKQVRSDVKLWPFEVISKDNRPMVRVNYKGAEKLFSPTEISAMVLSKLKQIAEDYLGTPVTDAVVTVPAYFNDDQKSSTKDAATVAGLNVVRLLNEPTAAALAYGVNKNTVESNVIVFDLGGGTFDVSLLTLDEGVFEVMAVNGDTHLGGDDFDQRMVDHFVKTFEKKHKIDISDNVKALSKLRKEVEKAKRGLSSASQIRIDIDNFVDGIDFSETFTRARFEQINGDLFRRTLKPLERVLKDAKMTKSDIDEIVLVGGSTRIPKIKEIVETFFGKKANRGINPDEAVAIGAAIQGAIINPQQSGDSVPPLVIDVAPLSLGIETVGGVMTKIIERNTQIPASKSQIFSTYQNNQPQVTIQVFQGERSMAKDNMFLGKFDLSGIAPAPRGVPKISVTFDIDTDGLLKVSAKEDNAGQNQITITRDDAHRSKAEIDEMVAQAQLFADDDQRLRQTVEIKNKLENDAFTLKSRMENGEMSVGDSDEMILEACDEVISWLDMNSDSAELEDFQHKMDEFNDIVNPILSQEQSSYYDAYDHEEL